MTTPDANDASPHRDRDRPILPGATLGVLGGGQLGRMFALAARSMGYRIHVLCPDRDAPAAQVADAVVEADYHDVEACERFARDVAAVTFEFENVPAEMCDAAERHAIVRPAGRVLHTTQDRQREKGFLRDAGLPVTPFEPVDSLEELQRVVKELGTPAVLKTAAWGYDGKGQAVVWNESDCESAWREIGQQRAVLEKRIDFDRELSVVAVRSLTGELATYGPLHNHHAHHILDLTTCPAPNVPPGVADEAIRIARKVMEKLDVVGVLCVEMFLTAPTDHAPAQLMINELAPRPHNSGHLTIDAFATSQFEQQVRALCGLPLGSTTQHRPAAMANLLGDLWFDPQGNPREPDWPAALATAHHSTHHADAGTNASVHLHLYGKAEPRPGRKMGHLTALADTPEQAQRLAQQARHALQAESKTPAHA
ncbi:MAG: 5-(carboxyamino)imidazole ribonucleotide synthase [Phycisphaeraceae bacterium]